MRKYIEWYKKKPELIIYHSVNSIGLGISKGRSMTNFWKEGGET